MKSFSLRTGRVLAGFGLTALVATTTCPQATAQVNEDLKLLPGDGAAGDNFGWYVAVSGTTAVVGAIADDDNGLQSGSAYVFDVTTGQQSAKLLPSNGAANDNFGFSVAISGTTVAVGAPGNNGGAGSAYLFDATTGQQIAKLLPSSGAGGDSFGLSVAISGTTVAVGAPGVNGGSGSAYVFDATTGQQIAKVVPNDGANDDNFGYSVAISGTTVVVGAYWDDDNGVDSGSAYVFDATTGQQIAKLVPSDGATGDRFAKSVAISGTAVVAGAPGHNAGSGSAYLFDATTGQQIAKLVPSDGATGDRCGRSVTISGTAAIVGAWGADENGTESGAAYLFDATTGQQIAKLLASDGTSYDYFGGSVSINGATVVAGAKGDDGAHGTDSGSAYVISLDCNGNGSPDFEDIVNGSSQDCDGNGQPDECQIADEPSLDWNGDGVLDTCSSPSYCDAAPNSTGAPAVVGARGSPLVSDDDFTLEAVNLPIFQFAYFLTSETTDFVPGFQGSSGNLCLGAPIYRFNDPATGGLVLNSHLSGTVSFTLDLGLLPQGITFDPGETWYFQLWFRDVIASGPTSNTTDGIEVMFR